MGIVSNRRTAETSSYSITSEGKVVRAYTQKRRVVADVDYSNAQVALALGYSVGQPFSTDTASLLLGMDLDRLQTLVPFWDLTLKFSTDCPAPAEDSPDPTQQRVKRSWQTSEHSLYVVRDRNGDLIVNAAKQPFDGGVPVTLELPTLVLERNESTFDGATATALANCLNRYSFSGADPKTLKLKITAAEQHEGKYIFWAIKYEMAYFPLGWQPRLVNAGLKQLDGSGHLVDCRDDNRLSVTSPVPLDLAGLQIPIASLPAAVNYIEVDWFPLYDYYNFGLPA